MVCSEEVISLLNTTKSLEEDLGRLFLQRRFIYGIKIKSLLSTNISIV